jgi:hypothetical protein
MSISLEGLMSPGGDETRALALLKVEHNGLTYDWQAFVPPNTDLTSQKQRSKHRLTLKKRHGQHSRPRLGKLLIR